MLLQNIGFIIFMGSRMRQGRKGIFTASIHTIVMLSITMGVASILLASMIMHGFQVEIKKKIVTFLGDFQVAKRSSRLCASASSALHAEQVKGLLAAVPYEIEKVSAFVQKPLLIHTRIGIDGVLCKGLDPSTVHQAVADYIIAGRLPTLTAANFCNEVLISHYFAQKLGIQVGDRIMVHAMFPTLRCRKLKIVGIYCTYVKDIDSSLAFCDMRLLQHLNQWGVDTVSGYEIVLKEGIAATRALHNTFLHLIDNDQLYIYRSSQSHAAIYNWLLIMQKHTTIFIAFILLVAGFTMVATVMIQLMERNYMVDVLKSLGAFDWQVRMILFWNSFFPVCRGILYGNMMGMGICFLQFHYRFVPLEPSLYYMRYLPIAWRWHSIVLLNGLIVSVICASICIAIQILRQRLTSESLQGRS